MNTLMDLSNCTPSVHDHRRARLRWPRIDRTECRLSVSIGLPIMLTAWVNMGMSVTDTWLVSWLGPGAMAAVAVGSDFYSIVLYFFAGILAGLTPSLAAAVAGNARWRVQEIWTMNWLVCLGCVLLAVPIVWFAPRFLAQAGVPSQLLDPGAAYTRCLALCLLPMLAIGVMRSMLVVQHRPRVFLVVTLCALPVNAVLDLVLIHGIGPLDGLGVAGAGLATLLTSCGIALAMFAQLQRQTFAREGALRLRLGCLADGVVAIRVGLPIGATTLAEVGIYLGATLYLASVSIEAVAAHTLTMRLAGIAYALPMALSQVATVRMAQATTTTASRTVVETQLLLAFATSAFLCVLLVLLAEPVAALLDDGTLLGQQAAGTACTLLLLLALTEVVEPFTATATGLLRGRQDTFVPMLFSIAGYWLFSAPLALWLVPHVAGDAVAVWLSLLLGMLLTGVLLARRLYRHDPSFMQNVDG